MENSTGVKKCIWCLRELSLSFFSKNNAAKDKLQTKCKECDNAYARKRREKDVEGHRNKARKYVQEKKHVHTWRLHQLLHQARRRAKEKNVPFSLTLQDVIDKYPADGKCPVFKFDLKWGDRGFRETSPSIDRIVPSLGYTPDNVQVISWKANRIKCDHSISDLETVLLFLKGSP